MIKVSDRLGHFLPRFYINPSLFLPLLFFLSWQRKIPEKNRLGRALQFSFLPGFLTWVDNYAHIFGFTGGLLLSFTIMPYVRSSEATDWNRRIGRSACLLGYVVLLATGLSIFYLVPDFDCQVNSENNAPCVEWR